MERCTASVMGDCSLVRMGWKTRALIFAFPRPAPPPHVSQVRAEAKVAAVEAEGKLLGAEDAHSKELAALRQQLKDAREAQSKVGLAATGADGATESLEPNPKKSLFSASTSSPGSQAGLLTLGRCRGGSLWSKAGRGGGETPQPGNPG